MDVSCVSALPLALKRRLLRKGILSVKGDLRRITSFHVKDALRLFDESQKGKKIDLPGNLRISCLGDCVEFKRILDSPSGILTNEESMKSDWKKPLIIPGETPVEDTGLTFRAEIIDPGDVEYSTDPSSQAFLDFEKTGKNIMIRFFQAGDRLTPFGMKGTKKLKSLFIDEKVPREIRSTIPILTTDDNDIIWVYGTRIADPYRVTSNTSKVLFIRGLS
jgi:tRNA(Ile)-lysidine synthase